MAFLMEENEAFDPVDVRFFGADGEMFDAGHVMDAVKQSGLLHGSPLLQSACMEYTKGVDSCKHSIGGVPSIMGLILSVYPHTYMTFIVPFPI